MNTKNYLIFVLMSVIVFMTACNDVLKTDPLTEVTPKNFFNTASDLKLFTNSFYPMFPGESIYEGDSRSDNIIENSLADRVRGTRVVPTDAGEAGWTWDNLRKINYFLAHYETSRDEQAKKHYSGVARFFRAYFYFNKVQRFGDVPWYSTPIDPTNKEALQKPRDPRGLVIDSVLADLNYAIANMKAAPKVYRVTKWTALALKSRVGLYAGTWRKYHDLGGYEKYLTAAWQAAEKLMESGMYAIYSTGAIQEDYKHLFAANDAIAEEIILARQYGQQIDHKANYYTITASYGMPGMPKDLVNSYLMKDGSRYTKQPGYLKNMFVEEVKNRDPRLCQTIRCPGYTRIGTSETLPPNLGATTTGYQIIKYVTEPEYDSFDSNVNDLPLFRYAEVLLNYAEAKAELGIITQADLDRSINLLRNRVGMPHLNLAWANAHPDPFLQAQYLNVDNGPNQGVILEIRRERRIELFMEGFRWGDLMRWAEGQKLEQPFRGLYFPGAGKYDLEDDGDIDVVIHAEPINNKEIDAVYLELGVDIVLDNQGLIVPHPGSNRVFEAPKDYLYPLPRTELLLNPNLEQNPGWGK